MIHSFVHPNDRFDQWIDMMMMMTITHCQLHAHFNVELSELLYLEFDGTFCTGSHNYGVQKVITVFIGLQQIQQATQNLSIINDCSNTTE